MIATSSSGRAHQALLVAAAASLAGCAASLLSGAWFAGFFAALGLVSCVFGIKNINQTNKSLAKASATCAAAANGDLTARVLHISGTGQISVMLRNINRLLDLTEAFCKEAQAAISSAQDRKYYRQIVTTGLKGEFVHYAATVNKTLQMMEQRDRDFLNFAENRVKTVADNVTQMASALVGDAGNMSSQASRTTEQSLTAASGANQASANVQAVAAAVEEFSASIGEINQQVNRAAAIAQTAAKTAIRTDTTVRGLSEAAERIGAVVQLIHDIAGQTNLLALNATIEAARAGEAGKGFAVVANEVKSLANQTAKATEEISAQVAQMQAVSAEATDAIREISTTVGEIEMASSAVAGAVEEQSAVTREIARNVSEAANGTAAVSHAIGLVQTVANDTGNSANEVSDKASRLSQLSDQLMVDIDAFLNQIKTH